jgi:hypothetical protein
MDDQTDIFAFPAMALDHKPFVLYDGVGSPFRHVMDGAFHVLQPVNGTH